MTGMPSWFKVYFPDRENRMHEVEARTPTEAAQIAAHDEYRREEFDMMNAIVATPNAKSKRQRAICYSVWTEPQVSIETGPAEPISEDDLPPFLKGK